ncbi:MAG: hypothetical protein JWL64_1456 [Frankiales bacterium]|nr:hypothetical protein [Frankiales bacterium]
MQRRWWAAYLGAGAVCSSCYLLFPGDRARAITYLLIGVSGVVALVAGVRLHRPAQAAPWLLMAAGQFCWVVGDSCYAWQTEVGGTTPVPSVADVFYLGAYPLVGAGIALLVRLREGRRDVGAVIDSAILTISVGTAVWLCLAGPLMTDAGTGLSERLIVLAYPAADILLLGILLRLHATPGARTTPFRLLMAAVSLLVVADTAFGTFGSSYTSGPYDLLWLASYVVWGAAALHPAMGGLVSVAPAPPVLGLSVRRLALLTVAVLVAPTALAVELLLGRPIDGWALVVSSTLLFLLVVARMHLAIRHIVASTRLRERLQDELAHEVAHDSLTGLPDRAHVLTLLAAALHRAQPTGDLVGMLAIDLDGFKAINDSYGHPVGDEVLREVASRISRLVRVGDTVGRLGGDEFVVFLEGLPDVDTLVALAHRLIEVVLEPLALPGGPLGIGVTVGVAVNAPGSTDAHQLLHHAGVATQRAKSAGRGGVQVFDDDVRRELETRERLECAVATGLLAGEFEMHYQPVIHLHTQAVTSYEALIRWQRPGVGFCAPDSFIPTAELSDLIIDVDRWALRRATQQLADWILADACRYAGVTVAVNVSGRHLGDPAVVQNVAAALAESRLPADRLVLEITETVLLDRPTAIEHLRSLRALGVAISIDDFGTGYTSIGQLQHLPVDTLKIDRSFISTSVPGSQELVALMINAAHAFGLDVVAEGVEEEGQLKPLRTHGCDFAQGYYFARPNSARSVPPPAGAAGGAAVFSAPVA